MGVVDYVFFGLLAIGPPCVPLILVLGWVRWWRGRASRTRGQFVSLAGLLFSTASALLGVLIYLHPFPGRGLLDTDAVFGFLWRMGIQTSLVGIALSIVGVGWPGPIRWSALAASLLTPFIWLGVGWDM